MARLRWHVICPLGLLCVLGCQFHGPRRDADRPQPTETRSDNSSASREPEPQMQNPLESNELRPVADRPQPTETRSDNASDSGEQDLRVQGPTGEWQQPEWFATAPASPVRFGLSRQGLPQRGNWKSDPAFADVNHDGHLDLAAHPRQGKGPQVWLGDGQGNWTLADNGLMFAERHSCGGGVALADVNHDDHVDLLVADHCRGVYVYLGDGAGNWNAVVQGMHSIKPASTGRGAGDWTGAEDLAVADINGDGHIDIVSGASDLGGIAIYLGDGTGAGWTQVFGSPDCEGWVNRVHLEDINGDGLIDLLASCSGGPHVWRSDANGGWRLYSDGLPAPMYKGLYGGIAAADFDEDGFKDLAVANWVDGPEVYLQQLDGGWKQLPDVFPDMRGGSYGLAVADLDADGHQDLLVSGRLPYQVGYVYGVFWLRGDGQAGFEFVPNSGLQYFGLPFTWGIAVADVDKDGMLDVAAGSGGTVATNPAYAEPDVQAGMLLWRNQGSNEAPKPVKGIGKANEAARSGQSVAADG